MDTFDPQKHQELMNRWKAKDFHKGAPRKTPTLRAARVKMKSI